jgi:hypothetical protein
MVTETRLDDVLDCFVKDQRQRNASGSICMRECNVKTITRILGTSLGSLSWTRAK